MATLLLSGLGSAVGGEFGALAGAMLGRSIDESLFGRGRSRNKEDLTVQTATYGRAIPKIFGTVRVGGSIIWATDLQSQAQATSGKLGAGATGYWAHFAVALSSRTARQVGRIWADGKLIRGVEGDFKIPTKFRFYTGDEDQSADPLISSIEGEDAAPAFRGLAVAVFEEFQLADFGNRVPFLTFEVQADDEHFTVSEIVSELSGEIVPVDPRHGSPKGFAAFGDSVGEALKSLAEVYDLEGIGTDRRRGPNGRTFQIEAHEMGCTSSDHVGTADVRRIASAKLPSQVRLGYFDIEQDLQASEQKVAWPDSGLESRIELPALLTAGDAKTLAQAVLVRKWAQRERRTVRLPQRYVALRPGDRLDVPEVGEMVVDQVVIEELSVVAECRRNHEVGPSLLANHGRSLSSLDGRSSPSEVFLLDLPAFDAAPVIPSLVVGARGGAEPWRRMPVTLTTTDRGSDNILIESPAVAGLSRTVLGIGSAELVDRKNSVVVELCDDGWLENCSLEDILNGANLALLGDEIIQFSDVQPLSNRVFKLGSLLRGRYGTEYAISAHSEGELFFPLNTGNQRRIELPMVSIGSVIRAEGRGLGDQLGASETELFYQAEALRPPSPAHLSARQRPDGSLLVTWVRRSRCGYHWFDRVDAPLAEEQERYVVTVTGSAGHLEVLTGDAKCIISRFQVDTLGRGDTRVEVSQLGSAMPSRASYIQVRI
ncbi:phage tail protein [Sphingomonas sp. KRR8]|uniref:phage tail protein n=1 Tax=Sphingomonas sp. KRR8 TaxID=2942996 RepID=UPI00202298C6|nr:phage tail protein [Sphingomonas sp. KRR8]URD62205.1 phage tail protein [Sphingomonas sp. KRR8]